MKMEDVVDVTASGAQGGATTALVATAAGWTMVEKTVFFGLITTGTVLSPWLVAAWAAGGLGLGAGTKALAIGLQSRKMRKEFGS